MSDILSGYNWNFWTHYMTQMTWAFWTHHLLVEHPALILQQLCFWELNELHSSDSQKKMFRIKMGRKKRRLSDSHSPSKTAKQLHTDDLSLKNLVSIISSYSSPNMFKALTTSNKPLWKFLFLLKLFCDHLHGSQPSQTVPLDQPHSFQGTHPNSQPFWWLERMHQEHLSC